MAEQDVSDRLDMRTDNGPGDRIWDLQKQVASLTKELADYRQIDLEQDAVNTRLSDELAQVKAENKHLKEAAPATVCASCGNGFDQPYDIYRCGDCEMPFHRECLRKVHFKEQVPPSERHELDRLKAENERLKAIIDDMTRDMAVEGWQPIETAPTDGTVILRPHRIWGAMDVRCCNAFVLSGKTYEWMNGDYTTAWPDEALLPFWMPLPEAPST